MIEFIWPQSTGEWLAWTSAAALLLAGCILVVAPRWWLALANLTEKDIPARALGQFRGSIGGGYIGLALSVLVLHPQPLLYLALGGVLIFTALGRLVSIYTDKSHSLYNWMMVAIEGILAFSPLAYALGYIA